AARCAAGRHVASHGHCPLAARLARYPGPVAVSEHSTLYTRQYKDRGRLHLAAMRASVLQSDTSAAAGAPDDRGSGHSISRDAASGTTRARATTGPRAGCGSVVVRIKRTLRH